MFLELADNSEFGPLNEVEQNIMKVLKPKIAEESENMSDRFPARLRLALDSFTGATKAAVSAGTVILDAAVASSLRPVESMVGQLKGMWHSMRGSVAIGSGSLSTTDTVSNIPPAPPPPAVCEGHASHNKQPPSIPHKAQPSQRPHQQNQVQPQRRPPPPTQTLLAEPEQQDMQSEGGSGFSSPRETEAVESDGSSEIVIDDEEGQVRHRDFGVCAGHAARYKKHVRKNYEANLAQSKIPRATTTQTRWSFSTEDHTDAQPRKRREHVGSASHAYKA